MLEFALTLPMFLLIVVGIVEVGRMVLVQTLVNDAARQAARAASLDGATQAQVFEVAQDRLLGAGVISSAITTVVEPSNLAAAETGDRVTVRVSVPFEDVNWLPTPWFVTGSTLSASSTWRRE